MIPRSPAPPVSQATVREAAAARTAVILFWPMSGQAAHTRAMRRRPVIALAVLLLTAAIWSVLAVWPPEPRYHGRSLRRWLEDLTSNSSEARSQAEDAFRQIGPKAVPVLVVCLNRKNDPPWKIKLVDLANRQSLIKVHFVSAELRRYQAVLALDALGPAGKDALPALEKMLFGNPHRFEAAFVIAEIGPEAVPSLTKGLTNESVAIRSHCRTGLDLVRNSGRSLPDEKRPDFIDRLTAFGLKADPEIDIQDTQLIRRR
jgi:hypothetical protein